MTDAYYSTRLRWHAGRGVAKLRGVVVSLSGPPDLGDGPVAEVDYAPEAKTMEVRRKPWDQRQDMTPAEVKAADALLHDLTTEDDA